MIGASKPADSVGFSPSTFFSGRGPAGLLAFFAGLALLFAPGCDSTQLRSPGEDEGQEESSEYRLSVGGGFTSGALSGDTLTVRCTRSVRVAGETDSVARETSCGAPEEVGFEEVEGTALGVECQHYRESGRVSFELYRGEELVAEKEDAGFFARVSAQDGSLD